MQSGQTNKGHLVTLIQLLLEGESNSAVAEAVHLLEARVAKEHIVEAIEKAMEQLDAKCTAEQFNLLEIMLVGRAAMSVMKEIYTFDEGMQSETKGAIIIATLEGDIHDIGKSIVTTILTAKGFRVIDCGKDCPIQTIIDTAEIENAEAILISGLLTTVVPNIKKIRQALADSYLQDTKVIAGGAALKQFSADALNVDLVGETAFDALHYLEGMIRYE